MKKNAIRILSLLLVVMTLVGVISLPVSAYSYPMNYTITYKTKDGKTLGTNSGQVDAEATVREALRVTSPSYDGYVLSDSNDSVVTGKMISWNFPASNYVRHGTGSYTVYYEKACKMVVHYVYGASRRTATADKTAYGKRGSGYTIYSPTISGYTPSKSSVSGSFSSESSSATVYYYESTYTISFNANGGSGAPSSITKKHFTNATLPTAKPYRTGYTFKGWGTSSSTSYASYQPGSTFYTNASMTLYAVWSAKTYTISYHANGGSGGPGSQTKTHGIKMLISRVEPTKSGYTFLGWSTYTTLMKATIAEAIGFDGSDDEKELLERQVNGLNEKMIAIVNESIASGEDIESREAEIKEIADTIEDLKRRIQIITENSMKNAEYADRIAEIERIITERASHQNEYDDSIVRQMVECIKVYADKHIEVIFGGGYTVEETVE